MIDRSANGVLLIFAKTPLPDYVKTRLIPELGARGAADLYRKMLFRTVAVASRSKFSLLELWCTPDAAHPDIEYCKQEYSLEVKLQVGNDLGERMYFALEHALERCEYAALIGCDCPGLDASDLDYAHARLKSGRHAVLGPAEDGGYYLLGLRQNNRRLFTGIEWGGTGVTQATRSRMAGLGWDWDELPVKWDVDSPVDVKRLQTERAGSF